MLGKRLTQTMVAGLLVYLRHFSSAKATAYDFFANLNVTIGNSGFSIKEVKRFTYSLVTVPTTKGPFKPDSVRIQRVKNLTGGNYWAWPSKQGVASSRKEVFQKKFSSGLDTGFRQDPSKAIEASHLNVGLPSIDTN